MNWSDITFFSKEEFECPCCGKELMDQAFVEKLDAVRESMGFPFPITSGYRCPDYNDQISSTGRTGPHTTGQAADIGLSHQQARKALYALAIRFGGIGLNQKGSGRFIHVDTLAPRIWTY